MIDRGREEGEGVRGGREGGRGREGERGREECAKRGQITFLLVAQQESNLGD